MYYHFIAISFILAGGLVLHLMDPFLRKGQRVKKAYALLNRINTMYAADRPAVVLSCLVNSEPFVYETLVLLVLELYGFTAIRYYRIDNNGDITGELISADNQIYLIEIRRYGGRLNGDHWNAFQDRVWLQHAAGGFFIHTGQSLPGDENYAGEEQVHMISGSRLTSLLRFQSGQFTEEPNGMKMRAC